MPEQKSATDGGGAPNGVVEVIFIRDTLERVMVYAKGVCIADTVRSKVLTDAKHPPVHYIPRSDVKMKFLQSSTHGSVCPFKGDCAYFDVAIEDVRMRNVAWSYPQPKTVAAEIAGYLAFSERKGGVGADDVRIDVFAPAAGS